MEGALDTRVSGGIRRAGDVYGVDGPQVVQASVDSVRMTTARSADLRNGVRTVSAEDGKNLSPWRIGASLPNDFPGVIAQVAVTV